MYKFYATELETAGAKSWIPMGMIMLMYIRRRLFGRQACAKMSTEKQIEQGENLPVPAKRMRLRKLLN